MIDHMQAAIAAFKEAWEQANQSQLKPEGYRTEAGLRAAEPHLRAMIAQEILDYWEACGELINMTQYREGIQDGMNRAAQIAKGDPK